MNIQNIIIVATNTAYSMFDLNVVYGSSNGVPFIMIAGFDVLSPITQSAMGAFIPIFRDITGSIINVITGFWLVQNLPSIIRGRPNIEPPTLMFADPIMHAQLMAEETLNF